MFSLFRNIDVCPTLFRFVLFDSPGDHQGEYISKCRVKIKQVVSVFAI